MSGILTSVRVQEAVVISILDDAPRATSIDKTMSQECVERLEASNLWRIRAGWRKYDIPYKPRNYKSRSERVWKLGGMGILTLEGLRQSEKSLLQRKRCGRWGRHYTGRGLRSYRAALSSLVLLLAWS